MITLPQTRRGIVIQTNYSPCQCNQERCNVFPDLDYGLDWFQWATEDSSKSWILEDQEGECPKCGVPTTYDEHYIITHMDRIHVEGWHEPRTLNHES